MEESKVLDDETAQVLADMLDEPYRKYWAALGHFIHNFSHAEATLQSLAFHIAGVTDPIGKAVFHGLRADQGKNTINRMLEATGQLDLKAELEKPFAQLGLIGSMRNNIVHWGAADVHGVGLVVTNKRIAHTKERIQTYTVSHETLEDMTVDLSNIMFWFAMVMIRRESERASPPDWLVPMMRELVERPWRYKQPQQPPPKKTSGIRAPRRERKRQQDA